MEHKKSILTKEQAEGLDEVKKTLENINITIDEAKKFYDQGYEAKRIGFLQDT